MAFAWCALGAVASPAHDCGTLIVGARVVDGTGAAARAASVRVVGERVAAVGKLPPCRGEEVVDAGGHVLAPGFIDTHSHHDVDLFAQPAALSAVSQGITTIVVGQDGTSSDPLAAYFRRLGETPPAVNIASYVGHNGIRMEVLGDDFRRAATPREIARMRAKVRAGMRAGALGLSTGLEYDPGAYSSPDEVLALAREAARYGGRYATHMRSEDRNLWQALDEAVAIGIATRMPVHVSHMKLAMVDWWGQAPRFLEVLDRARAAGIAMSGDVYPYEFWQSSIRILFPDRDFGNRAAAQFALRSLVPADGLRITHFSTQPSLAGKTLAQVASDRGIDPPAALMALAAEAQATRASEQVIATSMREDDIATLLSGEHANVCSDGELIDAHPGGAGAFTRVLRHYVRERHLLTLEEAVFKMTGASAAHAGIAGRGTIRPGAYADLVIFDPDRVSDAATIERPAALSVGIDSVWVNGVVVFARGQATGARPGRVIRRAGRGNASGGP